MIKVISHKTARIPDLLEFIQDENNYETLLIFAPYFSTVVFMNKEQLIAQIRQKRSFLCIGLDPDLEKLPAHLPKTPESIFEFNRSIIDATHQYCVSYKPNTAFYECYGVAGWII